MKKVKVLLAVALISVSVLSISTVYADTVETNLNTKEESLTVKSTNTISLHGNVTTGYEWWYTVRDESVAEITEEKFIPDDPIEQKDGSGQTQIWSVKGLKEGTTEVTFNYSRPWKEEIEESVTYVITVDSDLNVKVSEIQEEKLNIQVKVEEKDEEISNQINPTISLENKTDKPLDLSKVTVKYYYTAESFENESFNCYYAGTTSVAYKELTSFEEGKINKIRASDDKGNSDRCIEVTFNGGILDAGQSMEMNISVNKNNWSNYDKTNDYSFNNPDGIEIVVAK